MRTLLVFLSLLALPATAAAAPTDLGFKSADLDVVMTKDGAAHVARLEPRPNLSTAQVVKLCRIPKDATACTETASLTLPNTDDVVGPYLVTDGTKVVVAVGSSNGASDGTGQRTYASLSADGATYGALTKVATLEAKDVELSPAGDRLWISASTGPTGTSSDYLAFASAPLPTATTSNAVVLNTVSGGRSVDGQILGITPEGKPLAFLDGDAPDLKPSGSFYRPFNGAVNDTELHDASKWGAPVRYDLPDPAVRNGGKDVSSANGRLWLTYEGLQRDTVLRQFTGGSFGPATSPDCTTLRFPSGLQAAPDVAITRTNDLLITEVGGDGDNLHLGFFHANADASAFSPYQELATQPSIRDVETAADPTADSSGIAVWTTDAIYGDRGEVFFVRLPASAPFAACPVATASPTPTPTVTVSPTPTPTPTVKPTKTVSGSVGGATLKLTLPNACVTAGQSYTVKLAYKKPKKAKLRKVVKVVFSATGAKSRKDKKSPYSAKLTIPASTTSGKKIAVRAKVTVKLKGKKKKVTKTIKASFVAC